MFLNIIAFLIFALFFMCLGALFCRWADERRDRRRMAGRRSFDFSHRLAALEAKQRREKRSAELAEDMVRVRNFGAVDVGSGAGSRLPPPPPRDGPYIYTTRGGRTRS